jgi:hypothetical protein
LGPDQLHGERPSLLGSQLDLLRRLDLFGEREQLQRPGYDVHRRQRDLHHGVDVLGQREFV